MNGRTSHINLLNGPTEANQDEIIASLKPGSSLFSQLEAIAKPSSHEGRDTEKGNLITNIHYDGKSYYWPRENGPGYLKFTLTDTKRELRRMGRTNKPGAKENLSEVDEIISDINRNRYVDWAGPLAGHRCGLIKDTKSGQQLLVTNEPRLLIPTPGDFPTIETFITDLLCDQTRWFLAWMSSSLRNLVEFMDEKALFQPAPAVALCGPRNCGKTLLIEIIATIFGRRQSAYNWMVGNTNFNSELIGAELLTCDDESGHTDMRMRKQMGNRIKSSLFSGAVKGEEKGKEAFTVRPWWRLVIATNDEPEDLRILPPYDDSMLDKLSMFKCYRHEIVMPDATQTERWAQIEAEIPAFMYDLLHKFVIPQEMKDRRTGAKAYQHPDLVGAIAAMDPANKLLQQIDEAMKARLPGEFTASEVERLLTDQSAPTVYEAKRLLTYSNTCGTYLSRLAHTNPDRVTITSTAGGINKYRITLNF